MDPGLVARIQRIFEEARRRPDAQMIGPISEVHRALDASEAQLPDLLPNEMPPELTSVVIAFRDGYRSLRQCLLEIERFLKQGGRALEAAEKALLAGNEKLTAAAVGLQALSGGGDLELVA